MPAYAIITTAILTVVVAVMVGIVIWMLLDELQRRRAWRRHLQALAKLEKKDLTRSPSE